jgi:hypothetical protein
VCMGAYFDDARFRAASGMGKFGFSFFLDERGWSYSLEYISLSGTYLDEMGKLAKWSGVI